MKPISRQLAEWCANVEQSDVPAAGVHDLIPLRILDTLGLIIAASNTDAVKAARMVAESLGGAAQSTVVGSVQRLPSSSAALVHGIAAHCHDFDDTLPDSVVHPGSVVIPTAVAVAEALDATNADFCVSITIGYEVAARIGAVAGRLFHARNMHATGFVGPLVAAAVAGRLRRLTSEQMSWAMGLAASMSGGTRAYAKDGGWSKWLHVGWAAHGGIMAADLAARGFRGPEHVLDGGSDLYSVMLRGDQVDRSALLADLGQIWKGAAAEFKYYPCAHVIHPFIDAVLAIVRQENLHATDIKEIECTIAPWAAAIVCEPRDAKLRFDTELEAIGSLPYQLSAAVLERSVSLNSLHETMRKRADIGEFARRVLYRKDETLGRSFDGTIEVRTESGQSFVRKATLAGNDGEKVRDKFIGLVEPILGRTFAHDMAERLLKSHGDWICVLDLLHAVKPAEPPSAPRAAMAAGRNAAKT
jgi:2-methylcitrate dehydratase PrpD